MRAVLVPKTVTLPMYLVLKRNGEIQKKAQVFHTKWASISKQTFVLFERGLELEQNGKSAEAEVEFRKAVELSPNFSPAHTEIGKLSLKAGKTEAAVESCKTAIRYDDADFDAHLNLGMAYMSLKQLDLAEPEFVNAAFIDRTAVTPHYYLGILYVMKDNLDIAQKAFETAKGLSGGGLPAIHRFLGRIYVKGGRQREGIEELETYIKLAPKAQDAEKVKKEISDIKAKITKNAFV
jgi:tetratricopeptide (TPR) repeat protein